MFLDLYDKMPFKKYRGLGYTVEDIAKKDPKYLEWLYDVGAATFSEDVERLIALPFTEPKEIRRSV